MPHIKLVITDIDGVWTDGGMYYASDGTELKKFSVYDGWGVKWLRDEGLEPIIMTGENNDIVINRANKLKIQEYHLGVTDKVALASQICKERGVGLHEVAFIGDELNDLNLLRAVGFSACPSQASEYIKREVDVVLSTKGGEGAFKAFAIEIIGLENLDL